MNLELAAAVQRQRALELRQAKRGIVRPSTFAHEREALRAHLRGDNTDRIQLRVRQGMPRVMRSLLALTLSIHQQGVALDRPGSTRKARDSGEVLALRD